MVFWWNDDWSLTNGLFVVDSMRLGSSSCRTLFCVLEATLHYELYCFSKLKLCACSNDRSVVISNRTGGTCLIATFLSDLKRLAARNFSLPFLKLEKLSCRWNLLTRVGGFAKRKVQFMSRQSSFCWILIRSNLESARRCFLRNWQLSRKSETSEVIFSSDLFLSADQSTKL